VRPALRLPDVHRQDRLRAPQTHEAPPR
jgi:hypothetical protein